MANRKISITIPAYNEDAFLRRLIPELKLKCRFHEVVLVNDGSTDQFCEATALHGNILAVHHPYNIGNGAAIKTGIRIAKGDILVFMDADGQHDPEDIPKLLTHMDGYDMVVGARTDRQHSSLGRRLMNAAYNRLASFVTGFPVKDLTSGFRAVRADLARDMLPLLPNGYSWPTTMTLVLLRSGFSVKYVPINVRPRQHGRSRIRPVRDGIRFFMIILKICTLYSPLRIFLPVSGGIFLMGLINYAYTYLTAHRFTNMSALLFSTSVIIFMMGLISEQISQISLLRQQVRPPEGQACKKDGQEDLDPKHRD
ncbi:glycosyltransferase family 2 protein [Desulfatitalea tepidiphila]|uniref:glycosyltransferase family 2 protein n=1 Tax=Desulfatitalea tepidiphila TaxID=1185843 RepID=UPI000978301C|nr:glycosyltransferase family 2 protein [Desulfatitalea tepidiphila]